MIDRGHVHQPGEDPLAPRPMTPEQIAALVAEARRREYGGVAQRIRAGFGWRRRADLRPRRPG